MIVLNDVVSSNNTSVMNANFQKIQDVLNGDVVKRNVEVGEANELNTHLDMNQNRITNLAPGVTANDAATKGQLDFIAAGGVTEVLAGANVVVDSTDPAKPVVSSTASGGVSSVVAGANIAVDNTDPNNPVVSSTASGSSTFHGASMRVTTDINNRNGTYTIPFGFVEYDTDGFTSHGVDDTKLTIPAGVAKVQVTSFVELGNHSTSIPVTMHIKLYNSAGVYQRRWAGGNELGYDSTLATITTPCVQVSAGDYFIVVVVTTDTAWSVTTADLAVEYKDGTL